MKAYNARSSIVYAVHCREIRVGDGAVVVVLSGDPFTDGCSARTSFRIDRECESRGDGGCVKPRSERASTMSGDLTRCETTSLADAGGHCVVRITSTRRIPLRFGDVVDSRSDGGGGRR